MGQREGGCPAPVSPKTECLPSFPNLVIVLLLAVWYSATNGQGHGHECINKRGCSLASWTNSGGSWAEGQRVWWQIKRSNPSQIWAIKSLSDYNPASVLSLFQITFKTYTHFFNWRPGWVVVFIHPPQIIILGILAKNTGVDAIRAVSIVGSLSCLILLPSQRHRSLPSHSQHPY